MLALLLFAFCAAICIQIFNAASSRARDAEALSQAVFKATEAAELYKASGGDLEKTADAYDRVHRSYFDDTLTVYYDENWDETLNPLLSSVSLNDSYYKLIVTETGAREARIAVVESAKTELANKPDSVELHTVVVQEARDIFTIEVKAVRADG
jgi:type II secretory pathway pseudopilin PulG